MEMRPRGTSGRTEASDNGSRRHLVTDTDSNGREMRVAGGKAALVLDLDHLPVCAVPFGGRSRGLAQWRERALPIRPENQCPCASQGRV